MPQPEGAQLNFGFSPILTNVGLNLLPKLDQYIGASLLPSVGVASPVGTYNFWNPGDFLRRNGKKIANYEAVPLGGFASKQLTYSVTNWGVGTPYTNVDLANARRGGMSDQQFKNNKARWVTTQGVLEKEFRVQALIQTTGNWTTTYAGVASAPNATQFVAWDQAAATPVDDVKVWKRAMRLITGYEPNTMVIPEKVVMALFKNAQILDRVKTSLTGDNGGKPVQVEMAHLESLFAVTILCPKGVYNSAAEGQTDVFADIWTYTIMWLGYVSKTPSIDEPSAGYVFNWTGNTGEGLPAGLTGEGPQMPGAAENNEGLFIREYMDIPKGATVIEGMLWGSPNVVSADLGATFTATIT